MNLCECGCGKEVTFSFNKFLRGHNNRNKVWSEESKLKAKISALSKEVQNKRKQTLLSLYGIEHPMYSQQVKDKIKETCLNRYKVENPSQSEEIKNKKVQTCLDNFGVQYPFQSKEIREKSKQTVLENFGVKNVSQSQIIKSKKTQTCLNHFQVDNPFKLKEIREKSKITSVIKYGTQHPTQSEEIKKKIRETTLKHFGIEYYTQTAESRKLSRLIHLKYVEKQKLNGEILVPCIGNNERNCLNELEKLIEFKILRQQRVIGYFPDGYIKELNLIIEFDESCHYCDNILLESDQRRQKELTEYLHCKFFRIKESDWLNNKDIIINDFKTLIKKESIDYDKEKTGGNNAS
jgi:very-short-patch-repair endonuclease